MTEYIKELLEIAGCSALFAARAILDGIECVPDCVPDGALRQEISQDPESAECEKLAFSFLVACGSVLSGSAICAVIKKNAFGVSV